MSDDGWFCPRHGRSTRPIEILGLRCDCPFIIIPPRAHIYAKIDAECDRQRCLFGDRSIGGHTLILDTKLRVLCEEVGEVARAIDSLEKAQGRRVPADVAAALQHLRDELVQVGACAAHWLESLG